MFNILKHSRSTVSKMQMLGMSRAFVHTPPGKFYVVPDGIKDVIDHLDKKRPTYTCVYFTAAWNPKCAEIEQDYENFTTNHGNWHHLRVDCDKTHDVKRYFDARVEPQFLFLVNGGEINRTVGYNFLKLEEMCKTIETRHQKEIQYHGDSGKTWERFYDEFDRWSRFGEGDRDGFRAYLEPQGDRHRGPGTEGM